MSSFLKHNRGLSRSLLKIYEIVSSSTLEYYEPHSSGNVDVFLNGIALIPQITSSTDISGTNNLTSGKYDFQSGTMTFNGSTNLWENFVADEKAQITSTHIKLISAPNVGDILMIRSY